MPYALFSDLPGSSGDRRVVEHYDTVVQNVTGGDVQRAQFIRGNQIVVLKVYSNMCGPCKTFAPAFDKFAQDHSRQGIAFVQEDIQSVKKSTDGFAELVKAVPTVVIFTSGRIFKIVTGANMNELTTAVQNASRLV